MDLNPKKQFSTKYISFLVAATLLIGTVSALSISGGSLEPADPVPGSTVNNQKISFVAEEVSADGDTDIFYLELANELNSSLSVNGVSVDNASVSSSPEMIEGYDNDTVVDTMTFAVSPTGGDNVTLDITADMSINYPNNSAEYPVEVRVVDSKFGSVTAQPTTMTVGDTEEDSTSDSSEETDETTDNQDSSDTESSSDDTESTEESTDTETEDSDSSSTDSTDSDETTESNNDSESTESSEDTGFTGSPSDDSTADNSDTTSGSDTTQPDQGTESGTDDSGSTSDEGIISAIVSLLTGLI